MRRLLTLVLVAIVAALAAAAASAPLVLTAHGRDVRNVGEMPGVRALTWLTVRRASAVVAVSGYLRRELAARLPELDGRIEVVSSGVDLERFRHRDAEEARRDVGWAGEPPFFLCVGTLDERKNVVRLAAAFERLGRGSLALVGDGPTRAAVAGRPRVTLAGRVAHARVADWIAACDVVCQPSLVEPFGQALLEALASERSVVATRVGGPPEFVTPELRPSFRARTPPRAPPPPRTTFAARPPAWARSSPRRCGDAGHNDLVPHPAMHTGRWPAITRPQSPPSPLSRRPLLPAGGCGVWRGARDPEARQHYPKGH
jgi:hypothetical protein